jgi:ketosteroid isomerase-like protein
MDRPSPDLSTANARAGDRLLIAELLYAYAYHFDRNEPEVVASLFTEDAVIDYGPEVPDIRGRATIADRIRPGLDEIFAATSHHISNVSVTFAGADDAVAVAYVYAWQRFHDGSPDGHLWAQYHTRVRRTAEGWRIAELVLKAAGTVEFHRSAMHPIGRRST